MKRTHEIISRDVGSRCITASILQAHLFFINAVIFSHKQHPRWRQRHRYSHCFQLIHHPRIVVHLLGALFLITSVFFCSFSPLLITFNYLVDWIAPEADQQHGIYVLRNLSSQRLCIVGVHGNLQIICPIHTAVATQLSS